MSYLRMLKYKEGLSVECDSPLSPRSDLGILDVTPPTLTLSEDITQVSDMLGRNRQLDSSRSVPLPETGPLSWDLPAGGHVLVFNSAGEPKP